MAFYQWLVLSVPSNLKINDLLSSTFSSFVIDDWGSDPNVNNSKIYSIQAILDSESPLLTEFRKSFTWYRWCWCNSAVAVGSGYSGSHSTLESFNKFKSSYGVHFSRGRTVSNLQG